MSCAAVWRSHLWWTCTRIFPSCQPQAFMVLCRLAVHTSSSSGKFSPVGSSNNTAKGHSFGGSLERNRNTCSTRFGAFVMATGRLWKLNKIRAISILCDATACPLHPAVHQMTHVINSKLGFPFYIIISQMYFKNCIWYTVFVDLLQAIGMVSVSY